MTTDPALRGLTRRALLARAAMASAALAVGAGFVAAPDAAWALEVTNVKPETMATLIQMARDIYPHDQLADSYYAIAVKGYDTEADAAAVEEGIAALNAAAQGAGYQDYMSVGWESDRVALLREMQASPFFQKIRGGLVTGLYNQHEIWPIFGYQGESYSQGGYLHRGFDDISWL
jgi:hypothetical protein